MLTLKEIWNKMRCFFTGHQWVAEDTAMNGLMAMYTSRRIYCCRRCGERRSGPAQ